MLFKKRYTALTLLELIIAIILLGVIVIGFSSIELFSRYQVLSADRRTQVQNEVALVLEHMSKNVMQGVGDATTAPIWWTATNGFSVRIEHQSPPTVGNLSDDTIVSYTLSGNILTCSLDNEVISNRILSGVTNGQMPDNNPNSGFYIYINPADADLATNRAVIEIGLVGRYNPGQAASLDNPQVAMKSRLYTRSASAN